jgi:diguanylate cyclase (GGDEF)-like protein
VLSLAEDITDAQRLQAELTEANRGLRDQLRRIEQLQAELREQAMRDPLTGLYNRRQLHLTLTHLLAVPSGPPFSLVMIDLDHFKTVNDLHGHHAGDQLLIALGRLVLAASRPEDVACRYGGEEFIVVLPATDTAAAWERADSWRRAFAELVVATPAGPVQRTLSAGVATWPAHGDSPDRLLSAADGALYAAKANGRNRVLLAGALPLPRVPERRGRRGRADP